MGNQNNEPSLKIIPLGGLHEIGKNTCIFEYKNEILLLDAGLAFPSDDMHGINIVLPDTTYLQENQHKIKGMIVTHGHEDHIGGIAYHLKSFDIPVIHGPRLAMSLLRDKLEEARLLKHTTLNSVQPRETVRLGQNFSVEFIRNTHSIADSFSVAITTPIGVIIHSGDFKIDHTPVDGEYFDFQRLARYGEEGVLCLLSDSTNAEVPGHTPSERSIYPNLERVFLQAPGRLMVTTFASSVHRVNMILELAQKHRRKVAVIGRSMLNVIAHARNLGYVKAPDNLFVPLNSIAQVPDEQLLILTTGSQGEPLAAMTRIARGEHRQVKIRQGDTVVFSAQPIPGNTLAVVDTIDRLMVQGAVVAYGKQAGLHVSGHGAQEDHKLMLSLTRPKFFVPVHGEYRMLLKHASMAHDMGIPKENTVVINNGDVIELARNRIGIVDQVASGIEYVDRSGVVQKTIVKERQQLAEDGVITVAIAINASGKLLGVPLVSLRGVMVGSDLTLLERLIVRAVETTLERWSELSAKPSNPSELSNLKIELESSLVRLARRELRSKPSIVVLIQQIDNTETQSEVPSTLLRTRRRSTATIG
ncbi:MAG: ribonuclease J [Cyanobacteria bacterium P01_H01_bin.15]